MACNYSWHVWSVLILMIVTGAARSELVKLAYQSGFQAPLTVEILYLTGQALSSIVYLIQRMYGKQYYDSCCNFFGQVVEDEVTESESESNEAFIDNLETNLDVQKRWRNNDRRNNLKEESNALTGSRHGLTSESEEAVKWIHRVPWYMKPAIPAFFNLLNSTLRWASLVYLTASVAEMLISGFELALSVVAARVFRKRQVSLLRWAGVGLVTVGIMTIGLIEEYYGTGTPDETAASDKSLIGIVLLIFQCILSVLQDLVEEIFMQAADFPPTLILGLEGLYGLPLGVMLYLSVGHRFGETPTDTLALIRGNPEMIAWVIVLPFVFLATGVCNIKATEVTSAMTRNVWKNFRSALIWIVALLVFYIGGNSEFGEEWLVPQSFWFLVGYFIMTAGTVVYYWQKHREDNEKQYVENRLNDDIELVKQT